MVSRATESALQKNRKALPAAAGGGAAALAKKDEDSSGSTTPSPEKSVLLAPIGKPKRIRPVSTGNSPATSLVAAGGSSAQVQPLPVITALQSSANASISRPRAKKLLQGSLCFAVCAFDTTVPVPLRSAVSDFDALLVAIHNQVRYVALLPLSLSMAISFLFKSLPLPFHLTSNSFSWGSVSPTTSSSPLSPLMAKLCLAALPSKPRLLGALSLASF